MGPFETVAKVKADALRQQEVHQVCEPHPLGFHIWRDRRGWPRFGQRLREAWWIITGEWSLHRAWQKGHDHGHVQEVARQMRGGR